MPGNKLEDLPRKLGLLDATTTVIGTMIGGAIFIIPAAIAKEVPSIPTILAIWVATGLISFFGALAYAELGAMLPHSGGPYVYMREAYGPLPAFVTGWVFFLIINSGSIAAVSVVCATYLSYLLPGIPGLMRWAPVALILTLTAINYVGVRQGASYKICSRSSSWLASRCSSSAPSSTRAHPRSTGTCRSTSPPRL